MQHGEPYAKKCATPAFCMLSNNMLYPKESEGRTLVFACRQCSFIEPTADKCVYRNEFGKSQS
jgi:DNA-directed RNA polymerase II subunit RPB9